MSKLGNDWKNKSCGRCECYVAVEEGILKGFGDCRRFPPALVSHAPEVRFPIVNHDSDACAEYDEIPELDPLVKAEE